MKPIIFAKISDMKYYKGCTPDDMPVNGGSYVKEHEYAHECKNFFAADTDDGKGACLGFAMLTGGQGSKYPELHIENIVGCSTLKKEAQVDDVIVVWCSKARGSQNMRVVGFYKHATVYRDAKVAEFPEEEQIFNFIADKENCVLLPYSERHSNSKWYVPTSGKNNSSFGFGRHSLWYGGSNTDNADEIAFVERMIKSVEEYDGENWIDEGIV